MKRRALSALFVAVAAVAVRADRRRDARRHKMEQMAPDMTYVGCVERGSMVKAFVVHVTAGGDMKPAMKQDSDKKKDDNPAAAWIRGYRASRSTSRRRRCRDMGQSRLSVRWTTPALRRRGRRDESHADTEREVGEDGCGDVSVTSAIRG